ncbi:MULTISPECIES: hypothetical protein [unclassified Streptomyces]|uniref:hypothetical protein n=1 Tax=unclassified Streptomyces TaxID=2593676 RepID=UPI0016604C85|nr:MULTISPECIES: hypothetical protein [unclassified Streptomyces]
MRNPIVRVVELVLRRLLPPTGRRRSNGTPPPPPVPPTPPVPPVRGCGGLAPAGHCHARVLCLRAEGARLVRGAA